MSRRITFVGGGSAQWMPTLIADIANTPYFSAAELVLHDIDASRLAPIAQYVEHVAAKKPVHLTARTTTKLDEALDGTDFVVVCISTGGLASMEIDLDVSARYGIPMPIGDTVGPAGISRALRNVPVLVGIARAMEQWCPSAWMCNVTNPLTVLTRAVNKETAINAVGLCHEVTNARFFLSQLLDCGFFDLDLTVTGVNHLPLVMGATVNGDDVWPRLVDYAHRRANDLAQPLPTIDAVFERPTVTIGGQADEDERFAKPWTKEAVLDYFAVNFEVLRRFGALPAAGADHTAEFFAGFLTEASGSGSRWGIRPKTIADRREREKTFAAELDRRLHDDRVPAHRSPEMVAPVLEALATGKPYTLPLNVPNAGQCPDLPPDVVVESMCTVDRDGIRGRDAAHAPPVLAQHLQRIVTSQEYTLDAALHGERDALVAALFTDPLSSRLDHDALVALAGDIVESTRAWLPQF